MTRDYFTHFIFAWIIGERSSQLSVDGFTRREDMSVPGEYGAVFEARGYFRSPLRRQKDGVVSRQQL
jgi:hypothetical protein